ncbi:MAG: DUF4013 domain-containing protein [Anaerolineae bacterium]|nr:DUF4013 domain-containing protein [Anaerolineae bacterium]
MSDYSNTSSLKEAISFPFKSEGGSSRFFIGALISLANLVLPIIPSIFAFGYAIAVLRQVVNGEKPAMPEWKDWGKFGVDGLKASLVSLVYLLPAIILSIAGWGLYMLLYFIGIFLTTSNSSSEGLGMVLMLSALVILFLSLCVSMIFYLLGEIPLPVALAHWVSREHLGAAFDVKAISKIIGADKWGFLVAWVVVLGVGALLYFVSMIFYYTIILCFVAFIVAIPAGFYMLLVLAALFGQFYAENKNALLEEN